MTAPELLSKMEQTLAALELQLAALETQMTQANQRLARLERILPKVSWDFSNAPATNEDDE